MRNYAIKDECDRCGATGPAVRLVENDLTTLAEKLVNHPLPDGWKKDRAIGDLCDLCVAEIETGTRMLADATQRVIGDAARVLGTVAKFTKDSPDVPVG